ncbi:hypothetical protein [Bradyrhizobium canariense]|uniref:hypothetical protein n=1 Tax=Bradyrhizobium canariense TaxID=255045 RepID=UPI000A18D4E3|nr:hypothetical protein [Bradyrhizobium canariense]OSI20089.1 hypothetical protein BST65_35265 [Bradyrhizobium canariense]OSI26162.1 hypothetical protein BST66_38030 [Bradyrhizobium canariense]OSI37676.1 hypothetical protein BSZ20_38065 [Bradyrhizobium canariense]OSI42423.1 hypothetical protein BST67_37410 [Bradyrhizobium canariense]OSI57272.1 hypothetical protein BSZ15_14395 [Bradyrhizobium canariense]
MPDVGISLEAFLTLLFTVFAVPGACFFVMLGLVVRGLIRGYRIRSAHRRFERMYQRRLVQ